MRFPSADGIAKAVGSIDPVFLNTPLRRSDAIDRLSGVNILFKDETDNPIRSFKGRGACTFVAGVNADRLVCGSAGNFGQGLAWAARATGTRLTVFAAETAVPGKVTAMRRLGAEVLLMGRDFDEAKEAAKAHAANIGVVYVEDGREVAIAEGAGTMALEIMRDGRDFDAVLVPLGNGALASGVGTWVRHSAPGTQVVAVAASGAAAMAHAVLNDRPPHDLGLSTIADGIAVRIPIPYAVDCVRAVTDRVLLVDDDRIRAAMALLREHLGIVVEPAGAAAFAAVLADPASWRGRRIAISLAGGNVE